MPTCGDIINRSLRKLGRVGAGRDARPNDAQDCLEAFKGLFRAWITSGAFGRLSDVVPTASMTAGENQRIFRTADSVDTITLPLVVPAYAQPLPYNQERTNYEAVDGANRPPRDGAVIEIVDNDIGEVRSYIYDGQLRSWESIDDLLVSSTAPRSNRDPEGLAACLAMEVADMFGAEIPAITARQAARYTTAMTHNYSNPRQAGRSEYF